MVDKNCASSDSEIFPKTGDGSATLLVRDLFAIHDCTGLRLKKNILYQLPVKVHNYKIQEIKRHLKVVSVLSSIIHINLEEDNIL